MCILQRHWNGAQLVRTVPQCRPWNARVSAFVSRRSCVTESRTCRRPFNQRADDEGTACRAVGATSSWYHAGGTQPFPTLTPPGHSSCVWKRLVTYLPAGSPANKEPFAACSRQPAARTFPGPHAADQRVVGPHGWNRLTYLLCSLASYGGRGGKVARLLTSHLSLVVGATLQMLDFRNRLVKDRGLSELSFILKIFAFFSRLSASDSFRPRSPPTEEYTTRIQVDVMQGFQKCSSYREQRIYVPDFLFPGEGSWRPLQAGNVRGSGEARVMAMFRGTGAEVLVQAVWREHCTQVTSLALSGDDALYVRGNAALVAPASRPQTPRGKLPVGGTWKLSLQKLVDQSAKGRQQNFIKAVMPIMIFEVTMEQRQNARAEKRENPEETRQLAASSGTIKSRPHSSPAVDMHCDSLGRSRRSGIDVYPQEPQAHLLPQRGTCNLFMQILREALQFPEQHSNARAGATGDPRENPLIRGIVRQGSHV
ncbi:hypothetical protein PR048_002933 [Dryococelus australis]|uniref:Uncharacterized protein n=1 Tax=Dryococelus australis TaxID=614101 RepID=A0ABQ9ILR2_9NEOP|nr:hypothetical protein PR048_002933 [Dryococelus australis]